MIDKNLEDRILALELKIKQLEEELLRSNEAIITVASRTDRNFKSLANRWWY